MVGRGSERVEVLDVDGSEMLLNLSATGVAFLHSDPLEKNRLVTLTINEAQVQGRGVYCHQRTDGYRIGVRFSTVTAEQQAAVKRMVDSFSCGVPLHFSFAVSPSKQQHP